MKRRAKGKTNGIVKLMFLQQHKANIHSMTLAFILFVTGAIVMIYELVGTRVVSPYLGASTYVWTSIIGVVLASLSLGYWLGGNWADKQPSLQKLSPVFGIAAVLVACTGWISQLAQMLVYTVELSLGIEASLTAILLFAPTATLLGIISPYLTRLHIQTLSTAGKQLGFMSALSTLGSIVGTFLAGFWLIPFFGTEQLLIIISMILMLLGIICAAYTQQWQKIIAIGVVVSAIVWQRQMTLSQSLIIDVDTAYSRVQIRQAIDSYSNRPVLQMSTGAGEAQSAIYLDGDDYVFAYTKLMDVFQIIQPNPKQVLILGGAGYTMPRHVLQWQSEPEVTVVEIDPGMTKLARQYFGLSDHPRLEIHHADARRFLTSSDKQFDVILIDVFSHGYGIPFHIITKESLFEFKQHLKPNGVIVANIIGTPQGEHDELVGSIYKTFRSNFPNVSLYSTHPTQPSTLQNVVVLASQITANPTMLASSPYASSQLTQLPLSGIVLTDNYAPMEAMIHNQ